MRFRYLLLILFIITCASAKAQTVYLLKYHFMTGNLRDDYSALFVRNDDGTGFIRVAFTDRKYKSYNVYDMEVEEVYGEDDNGKEDTTVLIYYSTDPIRIRGKSGYRPDHFIFEYDPKTKYYEPSYVYTLSETDTTDEGKEGAFDSETLLTQKDLTRKFLLQYFDEDEEEFQNFFETADTRTVMVSPQQVKLHLVLVANTMDEQIGNTCVVDKNSVFRTYKNIADFLNIQFKPTIIEGENFSKVNVESAIKELSPGPSDIVVFYYSGHGFNYDNATTKYPYLDLRDKPSQMYGGQYTMNIENVFNSINEKGARLNIVMSDCCNADPRKINNTAGDGAATRTSSIGWNLANCQALFLDNKPYSLLVTAASKGELSAGNVNRGGIFTSNFRDALEKLLSPFSPSAGWDTLIASAKTQTAQAAKRIGCRQPDNSLRSCLQNPTFRSVK